MERAEGRMERNLHRNADDARFCCNRAQKTEPVAIGEKGREWGREDHL